MANKRVECLVLWDDGTWNSEFFDVSTDIPEDQIEETTRQVVFGTWKGVVDLIYCGFPDVEWEDEQDGQ